MSDSEVDEMTIWNGKNVFTTSTTGTLGATCNVLGFSKEPAGVTINPANNHLFISDDGKAHGLRDQPGARQYLLHRRRHACASFDTTLFRRWRPRRRWPLVREQSDRIRWSWIRDLRVSTLAANGIYGDGDDGASPILTPPAAASATPRVWATMPPANSLFIAARQELVLTETNFSGSVLNVWDISSFSGVVHPSGVAVGPSSNDPSGTSIYVTDRGIDNNQNPRENDGKDP